MVPHLKFAINEASQVGEARRAAVAMANAIGFDETQVGRVALLVTELANNLVRHAQRGVLLLGTSALGGQDAIEVLSLDHGPGMADVDRCLRDGFSTGGTAGTGFGAVQRLASEFSVFSVVGMGTGVAVRLSGRSATGGAAPRPRAFDVAGICLAAPGETVSGDAWRWREAGPRGRLIVADGLGHGPLAAHAADAAVDAFNGADARPAQVLERAHQQLRGLRGAVAAVAELQVDASTVLFCGAGNIVGRLLSGVDDRSMLSQHGTLGVESRRLQETEYAWPEHALVVLHSDGITSRWDVTETPGLLRCPPLLIAGWLVHHHLRGRDDATVVVVRRHRT